MFITFGKIQQAPIGSRVLELYQNYCVVDIETTGFNSLFDDIIEICAIRVRNGNILENFCELVKPDNDIPAYITELTGITPAMVENARSLQQVLPDFLDFVKDDIILGHNITFDLHFLSDSSNYLFHKPFLNNYINTLPLSRRAFPNIDKHTLKALSEQLSLSPPSHRAEADCIATKHLYDKITATAAEHNIDLFKRNQVKASDVVATTNEFDENNPFYNKVCVFTGALSIVRKEAMQLIANVGGINGDTVTKTTDFLIVGSTDYSASLKGEKSSKLKKAEKLIELGQDLQILTEETFLSLIKS